MSETTTTQRLQICIDRMRQGDAEARKQVFDLAYERLTILAQGAQGLPLAGRSARNRRHSP